MILVSLNASSKEKKNKRIEEFIFSRVGPKCLEFDEFKMHKVNCITYIAFSILNWSLSGINLHNKN